MDSPIRHNTIEASDANQQSAPLELSISPLPSAPRNPPVHLRLLQSQLSLTHVLLHGSNKLLEAEKLRSAAERLVADAEREMRIGVQNNREKLIDILFGNGPARGFVKVGNGLVGAEKGGEVDFAGEGSGDGGEHRHVISAGRISAADVVRMTGREEQEMDLISILENPESPESESSPHKSSPVGKDELNTAASSPLLGDGNVDVHALTGVLGAADWSSPPASPKKASKTTSFNSTFTNVPSGPRHHVTRGYRGTRGNRGGEREIQPASDQDRSFTQRPAWLQRNEPPSPYFEYGIRFKPNESENKHFRTAILSYLPLHISLYTLLFRAGAGAVSAIIVTLHGRGFLPPSGTSQLPHSAKIGLHNKTAMVVFETAVAAREFVRVVNGEHFAGNTLGLGVASVVLSPTYPGMFEARKVWRHKMEGGNVEKVRGDGTVSVNNADEIQLDDDCDELGSPAVFKSGPESEMGRNGEGSKDAVKYGGKDVKEKEKISWADEVIESISSAEDAGKKIV